MRRSVIPLGSRALVVLLAIATVVGASTRAWAEDEPTLEELFALARSISDPTKNFDNPISDLGTEPSEGGEEEGALGNQQWRKEILSDRTGEYAGYGPLIGSLPRTSPQKSELFHARIEADIAGDCSNIDFETYIDDYLSDQLNVLQAYFSNFTDLDTLVGLMTALGLAYLEPTIEEVMSKMRFTALGRLDARFDQCQAAQNLKKHADGVFGRARSYCEKVQRQQGVADDLAATICQTQEKMVEYASTVDGWADDAFDDDPGTIDLGDIYFFPILGPEPTEEDQEFAILIRKTLGERKLTVATEVPPEGYDGPAPPVYDGPPGLGLEAPEILPRDLYEEAFGFVLENCVEWQGRLVADEVLSEDDETNYIRATGGVTNFLRPVILKDAARYEPTEGWFCTQWSSAVAMEHVFRFHDAQRAYIEAAGSLGTTPVGEALDDDYRAASDEWRRQAEALVRTNEIARQAARNVEVAMAKMLARRLELYQHGRASEASTLLPVNSAFDPLLISEGAL